MQLELFPDETVEKTVQKSVLSLAFEPDQCPRIRKKQQRVEQRERERERERERGVERRKLE